MGHATKGLIVLAASIPFALPAPAARAQAMENVLSGFAGAADVGGRAMAEGMAAGPSVFVTAVGHAPRPRPQGHPFAIVVKGRAPSAVEAERLAAHETELALAAARRAGVPAAVDEQAFTTGDETANPMAAVLNSQAKDDKAAEAAPPAFTVTVTIRFRPADPAAEAGVLDAIAAAGGKFKLEAKARSILPGLDLARTPEAEDPAAWDRATQNAVAEAHRQAAVLAADAGVKLGEARQIVQLGRNTGAAQISVTVAVRYSIAP